MDILLWVVFGGLAGYAASRIMSGGHGMLEDIVLGIIGAFVGGFLMNAFGQQGITGFNLYSFIVAIVGAVVLIYLGRIFRRRSSFHF
jgi:uncharacterized membrane protein YeaQ/YmgE (transglycosylase-associated protein family)